MYFQEFLPGNAFDTRITAIGNRAFGFLRENRPRDFRARPLDIGQLETLAQGSANTFFAPVAGFDLDGGLAEGELLPGELTLAFDPSAFGIPRELWPHLSVAHVDTTGRLHPLRTRQQGSEVVAEVRHNSPYVLALVAALALKYVVDQGAKGAFADELADSVGEFRFFWPAAMPPRNTPEHRRIDEILQRRWKVYKDQPVPPDDPRPAWSVRLGRYLADPEVMAAYRDFRNPEWKKQNYYPAKVVHMVDAFQKAADYLLRVRRFRRRGDLIEIHGLDRWTQAADIYAYTKDEHFTYPYIQVNFTKVPATWPATGDGLDQRDDLNTTAVHELFHVVQKEYFNWTKYLNPTQVFYGSKFVWFSEATALVLEEEAKDHYMAAGWNHKRFPLTYGESKFIGLYKLPLGAEGATETEAGHKGYAASRFLLTLRDRYYTANKAAFLPTLLDSFSSFRVGAVDALVKSTSQSETVLGSDYLLFCSRNAYPIYQNAPAVKEVVLGRGRPVASWGLTGALSSPGLAIKWRGLAPEDLKKAKLLLRTNHSIEDQVYNRWGWFRAEKTEFRTITAPYLVLSPASAPVANAAHSSVAIQRVESYAKDPGWLTSGARLVADGVTGRRHETTALLLLPPKEAPKLRLDTEAQALHVEIPPSRLWTAGELKELRVRIHNPVGGRPLTFGLGGKTTADIKWDQIFGTEPGAEALPRQGLAGLLAFITPQDIEDMMAVAEWFSLYRGKGLSLQVSYLEVAKGDPLDPKDPGVEGPESEIFKVPVDGMTLAGLNYDVQGSWRGQIMLFHSPVMLSVEGDGGTLSHSGTTYRFRSVWSAKEMAYELTPFVREGNRETPAGITLYLRRLPGERLWLGAPPVVFHREKAAKQPGFWDWLFGRKG